MTTISWASGVGGDWTNASLWDAAIVPNAAGTSAAIGQPGSDAVTITAGETDYADAVLLGAPTASLEVGGHLKLTGTAPVSVVPGSGTIVSLASGVISGSGALTATSLINAGTLVADGGANQQLALYTTLTDSGTLLAIGGNLLIAEPITNLSGSTLTGGTYIAAGLIPANAASVATNQLAFGFSYSAVLAVDAATIVLDGPASLIEGYTNGTLVALEKQLETISAGGTLALLDGRDFAATNSLTDAGLLVLNGGTLSTQALTLAAGGTLSGYGSVAASLTNQGAVIANGGSLGPLILQSTVSGAGSLSVAPGSTLLLHGGSASASNIGGLLFDTGALTITGSTAGTGTIVVENGGSLELGGAATPSIAFGGGNVGATLDQPSLFQGTLVGFGAGDTLTLKGQQGNTAQVINNNTLVVMAGSSTLDAVTLAGSYANATFTATDVGNTTVITNISGAPARDGMPIELVNVTDNVGLSGSLIAAIENEVTYAAENWGRYITGVAPLRVSLTFTSSGGTGGEIATGGPGNYLADGQTPNGDPLYIPDSLQTLQTGDYAAGTTTDVAITVIASPSNVANLYINSDPTTGTAVPLGKIDLLSVLTHEFGHGLGIDGLINGVNPASGPSPIPTGAAETLFDSFVQQTTINGTISATFDGTNAEAAYGALINAGSSVPVPLWFSGGNLPTSNFYHLNGALSTLANDLMAPQLGEGASIPISTLDLAMLRDIGVPVTADVACLVMGTRILTVRGFVAVEDLTLADTVITARNALKPIIWIGRRRVDCRVHPRPERVWPIRFAADAFEPGIPKRDVCVSPDHAIYFAGVLIPARCLENDMTVVQIARDTVDYFHVELPDHDILIAEGLPVESYLDCSGRDAFTNAAGLTALSPEFAGDRWEGAGCAPLMLRGPDVESARVALRGRAIMLQCNAEELFDGT